nr:tripartite tricarboxylate transporter substrate binding protein [uncultured Sphaerochaeta sp.]
MKRMLLALLILTTITFSAFAQGGSEQATYPTKPITITIPVSAGGGTDLLVRAMSAPLKDILGETVNVVNKPGAGGAIGFAAGASDKNDGYSVTSMLAELITVTQVADVNFSYESFIPVCNVNSEYATLTVRADAPYDTVEEFVAYAKAHPGEVSIGNSGVGGIWHFIAAATADSMGIEVNHVPFEGGGTAVTALAGGHVDAVPVTPQEVDVQVKAGRAKVLAVLAPNRHPSLPNVPTASELGYEDLVFTIFRGFGVPLGTPDAVVKTLSDAFEQALNTPEITKFMEEKHYTKDFKTGADFGAQMAREEAVYAKMATQLGLKK